MNGIGPLHASSPFVSRAAPKPTATATVTDQPASSPQARASKAATGPAASPAALDRQAAAVRGAMALEPSAPDSVLSEAEKAWFRTALDQDGPGYGATPPARGQGLLRSV